MSDKTIAEIIGWEPIGDPFAPDGWITHDGRCVDEVTPNRPTTDDLLAWLSAPPMHTGIEGGPDDVTITRHHYGITVVRVQHAHGNRDDIVTAGATLHAALEAAVRAVHDAEEAR